MTKSNIKTKKEVEAILELFEIKKPTCTGDALERCASCSLRKKKIEQLEALLNPVEKEKQLTKYHLNLYDKGGKIVETFTLTSTGEILPGIWYNRELGLHPQIKKATNYPSPNEAPKGEAECFCDCHETPEGKKTIGCCKCRWFCPFCSLKGCHMCNGTGYVDMSQLPPAPDKEWDSKICPSCDKTKPIDEFWKNKTKKDGHNYICRECYRKIDRKRYYGNITKNRAVKNKTSKLMRKLYPDKFKARQLLKYSVKIGVTKKTPCVVCGDTKSQGHHPDYSKPLQVKWLCRIHHAEEHRRMGNKF